MVELGDIEGLFQRIWFHSSMILSYLQQKYV